MQRRLPRATGHDNFEFVPKFELEMTHISLQTSYRTPSLALHPDPQSLRNSIAFEVEVQASNVAPSEHRGLLGLAMH